MTTLKYDGFSYDSSKIHPKRMVDGMVGLLYSLSDVAGESYGGLVATTNLEKLLTLMKTANMMVEDERCIGCLWFADDESNLVAVYDKPSAMIFCATSAPKPGFVAGFDSYFQGITPQDAIEADWIGQIMGLFQEIIRRSLARPVAMPVVTAMPALNVDEDDFIRTEVDGEEVNLVIVDINGDPVELPPELIEVYTELARQLKQNGVIDSNEMQDVTDLARSIQQRTIGKLH